MKRQYFVNQSTSKLSSLQHTAINIEAGVEINKSYIKKLYFYFDSRHTEALLCWPSGLHNIILM